MKYYLTFRIFKTEAEARAHCYYLNEQATPYMRKHHPAHYNPLNIETGEFVVWYMSK